MLIKINFLYIDIFLTHAYYRADLTKQEKNRETLL